MARKPDPSYCLFGARAQLNRLSALSREVRAVRQAAEVEHVHHARVASRRVRTVLRLFADCLPARKVRAWRKPVRRITRGLRAARDADVQLAFVRDFLKGLPEGKLRPGVERLELRLRQKRQAAQEEIEQALARFERCGVIEDLTPALRRYCSRVKACPPPKKSTEVFRQALQAIRAKLARVVALGRSVRDPKRVEELHAMRIAAKDLRYTMEVFEPLYEGRLARPVKQVRKLQTLLGDVHDMDMWAEELPRFVKDERAKAVGFFGDAKPFRLLSPGLGRLAEHCRQLRRERHAKVAEFWKKLRKEQFGRELLSVLRQAERAARLAQKPPRPARPPRVKPPAA